MKENIGSIHMPSISSKSRKSVACHCCLHLPLVCWKLCFFFLFLHFFIIIVTHLLLVNKNLRLLFKRIWEEERKILSIFSSSSSMDGCCRHHHWHWSDYLVWKCLQKHISFFPSKKNENSLKLTSSISFLIPY